MDMIGGDKYSDKDTDSTEEETEEKFDGAAARKEASKALIRAVKNSDWQAVDDALYAHYRACSMENDD